MTRAEAFQTAVELSERGKHEDDVRNYPTALPLYELAMDYYLHAMKERDTKQNENIPGQS
jgi:hypothetical protein